MELGEVFRAIIMLFVVLDPLSVAPFYALEAARLKTAEERERMLRTVLLSALAMLLAFAIIGDYLLSLLNVNISDFEVAAGIILMVYAVASLFDIHIGSRSGEASSAIVPLAVPMLAGPGSISTLLYIKYTIGPTVALVSALVNVALSYPIFRYSQGLTRLLGTHGLSLLEKFMSFVMAGFAVSIIRAGIVTAS